MKTNVACENCHTVQVIDGFNEANPCVNCGHSMNTEKHVEALISREYKQVGLSAQWCVTAYQVAEQTVLIDHEDNGGNWSLVSYYEDRETGETMFYEDTGVYSWTGSLAAAYQLLLTLKFVDWRCDTTGGLIEHIAVANAQAIHDQTEADERDPFTVDNMTKAVEESRK